MEQEIADLAVDQKQKLNGFKVLGFVPFYLKYIRVSTHIKLCKIKDKLDKICEGKEPTLADFEDVELLNKVMPVIYQYCRTGLINDRPIGFILRPFLQAKLKQCSHKDILSLFVVINSLNQPAFFFTYWKSIRMKAGTILKEETLSSESSSRTKKKQEPPIKRF